MRAFLNARQLDAVGGNREGDDDEDHGDDTQTTEWLTPLLDNGNTFPANAAIIRRAAELVFEDFKEKVSKCIRNCVAHLPITGRTKATGPIHIRAYWSFQVASFHAPIAKTLPRSRWILGVSGINEAGMARRQQN